MNILSSHTMMLGLTIVLIVVMLFSLGSLSNQWTDFSKDTQAEKICYGVKQAVFDVYQPNSVGSNVVLGKRTINLPERIGDLSYNISVESDAIFVNVFNVTKSCKIGLPVILNGSSNGGLTSIVWKKAGIVDVVEIK